MPHGTYNFEQMATTCQEAKPTRLSLQYQLYFALLFEFCFDANEVKNHVVATAHLIYCRIYYKTWDLYHQIGYKEFCF